MSVPKVELIIPHLCSDLHPSLTSDFPSRPPGPSFVPQLFFARVYLSVIFFCVCVWVGER